MTEGLTEGIHLRRNLALEVDDANDEIARVSLDGIQPVHKVGAIVRLVVDDSDLWASTREIDETGPFPSCDEDCQEG